MLKKILLAVSVITSFFLIAFVAFFFWAKQPTLEKNQYDTIFQHHSETQKTTDSTLTIMTYNIGYLSGMTNNLAVSPSRDFYRKNEELAKQKIQQTNADIIGFQEIDFGGNRSYRVNQHQMIAHSGKYSHSAIAVNWDKNYVPFPTFPISTHFGKMLSGQSIVSRFPIEESERIVLERVADEDIFYKAFYLDRIAQVTKIQHPLQDFYVINIHVEAFDTPTRHRQLTYVRELFRTKNAELPVILIGDFNSDPSYPQAAINSFITDPTMGTVALEIADLTKSAKTYPSDKPYERLDYIFYSRNDFVVLDQAILSHYGEISDHLPCWAKLKIVPRK